MSSSSSSASHRCTNIDRQETIIAVRGGNKQRHAARVLRLFLLSRTTSVIIIITHPSKIPHQELQTSNDNITICVCDSLSVVCV